jgi:SAM-dependent methyltransferase
MDADRQRALGMYRRHARDYDYWTAWAEPVRRMTVERLRLKRGDVALDVGCGTGLNFGAIEEAIGPEGRLVGIELSPDMLGMARERVELEGWQNVSLLQSAVEDADIPLEADGVLFCFTHDILRSPESLDNVFGHVHEGGRVAAAGPKWAPWWAVSVNAGVWWVAGRYVTTFEGLERPWSHLSRFVPDLSVEPLYFGGGYIAWGTVPGEAT